MIKVHLVNIGMNVLDYRPLCDEMITWLDTNKITYNIAHEGWSDLPTALWFAHEEDVIVFKLKFGL
jgi:hypothetical protein